MDVRPGDEILVAAKKLGQPERRGTVVEVQVQSGRQRLSVDWDDGHQSIWMPHGLFKVVGHKPVAAQKHAKRMGGKRKGDVAPRIKVDQPPPHDAD